MKNRQEIETRIAELRDERSRLTDKLDKARAEERDALIEGKKPGNTSAAIATRIGIVDEALAELQERLGAAAASAERRQRTVRAENALQATAERAKLAKAVDDALTALAAAWPAYQEALRKDLGATSAANGDVSPIERGLVANRQNDVLVRTLVGAGGMGLARALGVETAIRERHAISLAAAEERVAESLRTELLRVRAESPQPNVAREAKQELEKMEKAG
ncbi:coiled-coil domain-containing protein [Mameliella alba]|uniref:Uncharacterized protein n=1 Tax=Mameliella alba TaxID=561184 RepID=A0A0B3S3Q3_9RHOB|nr:hypothetical protein [Mameliella alba]KHQ53603.1 hypothetical protein OA50_01590 [Mameliella alba]